LLDLRNLTIKDMMILALNELNKYEDNKNEKHLDNAKDVLSSIALTYDCERIDDKNFVFFEKNIFVINTPLINEPEEKHEARNNKKENS